MASRRMITKQFTLLHRQYQPSLRHIASRADESCDNVNSPSLSQPRCRLSNLIIPQNHNGSSLGSNGGFGALSGLSRSFPTMIFPTGFGSPLYSRYMSSSTGEDSCNVDRLVDIANLDTEETMEVVTTQVPGIFEVAVAAADSAFPVAALQYLIDGVQSVTGFNWWAAIALTTILVQGAVLPFVLPKRKIYNKIKLMRPRLLEIRDKLEALGPEASLDSLKQLNALFKEHEFSWITPFKVPLIRGSIFIIFFLALSNMAEKVPSFKTGGALWFMDLTAPDAWLILPVLASLSYWVGREYAMQEALKIINKQEDLIAFALKTQGRIAVRILASLIVPITMDFSMAHFCYWITSNLFSLSYALASRHPAVISFLDIPTLQTEPFSGSAFEPHNSENEPKQSPESLDGADRRASSDANQRGERKRNKKKKL